MYTYKRFRRRFRIPFELFQPLLIEECEMHDIFASVADLEGTGRTKQNPIEFKGLSHGKLLVPPKGY